METITSSNKGV